MQIQMCHGHNMLYSRGLCDILVEYAVFVYMSFFCNIVKYVDTIVVF